MNAIAFAAALLIVGTSVSLARDTASDLNKCALISADADRLACFDRAVSMLETPTYQGRLNMLTEPFAVDGPTMLQFQSDGAIFVLYLKSADGTVLQNLHIGGGGEDSYRIEQAGTYRLQINGSESWRVWLKPLSPK